MSSFYKILLFMILMVFVSGLVLSLNVFPSNGILFKDAADDPAVKLIMGGDLNAENVINLFYSADVAGVHLSFVTIFTLAGVIAALISFLFSDIRIFFVGVLLAGLYNMYKFSKSFFDSIINNVGTPPIVILGAIISVTILILFIFKITSSYLQEQE